MSSSTAQTAAMPMSLRHEVEGGRLAQAAQGGVEERFRGRDPRAALGHLPALPLAPLLLLHEAPKRQHMRVRAKVSVVVVTRVHGSKQACRLMGGTSAVGGPGAAASGGSDGGEPKVAAALADASSMPRKRSEGARSRLGHRQERFLTEAVGEPLRNHDHLWFTSFPVEGAVLSTASCTSRNSRCALRAAE